MKNKGPSSATQRKNKPPGGGGINGIGTTTTHIETPLVAAMDDEAGVVPTRSTSSSVHLLPLNSDPYDCSSTSHSNSASSSSRQSVHHNNNGASSSMTGTTTTTSSLLASSEQPPPNVVVAEVHRRFCGTGPFDKHWLNLDCCGLFCAFFTYMLHMYGCWAVCRKLLPSWMFTKTTEGVREISFWGEVHAIIFCGIAVMAIMSHFYAMTTDPGAVPPDAQPLEEATNADETNDPETGDVTSPKPPRKGKRLCRRCNSFKPQRAHHCSICRRCIIKMDHHCPWVNNCVGIGNHKFFLLFLLYTFLSCMYSMTLLLVRFWTCLGKRRCLDTPTDLLPLIGLFVEAMLFGLFTCCMMTDQWDVVTTNVTQIDKLKGEYNFASNSAYHHNHHHHHHHGAIPTGGHSTSTTGNKNKPSGVLEVFGLRPSTGSSSSSSTSTGFRFDWLVPFIKAHIPQGMRDEIMGFCTHTRDFCGSSRKEKMEDGDAPNKVNEDMVELLPSRNSTAATL